MSCRAKSDVVIENLGPGVAEKLGITYRKIRKTNPRIIYCKIESFGSGPYQKVPAFDPILQAAVGIMSTTGFPPDHYARAGISVVDMASGMHAASGILALLYDRKNRTEARAQSVSLRCGGVFHVLLGVHVRPVRERYLSSRLRTHLWRSVQFVQNERFLCVHRDCERSHLGSFLQVPFSRRSIRTMTRFHTSKERVSQKAVLESLVAHKVGKTSKHPKLNSRCLTLVFPSANSTL